VGFDAAKPSNLRPGDVISRPRIGVSPDPPQVCRGEGGQCVHREVVRAGPGRDKGNPSLGQEAKKKNLKIGCGLMCRHSASRQALIQKIRDGALGDILMIRAYRMDPGARMGPFKGGQSELLWQIRQPYFFLWVSSAWFIEMMIHQVDECCWIKDAWPVSAEGLGGCEPGSTDCSQNLPPSVRSPTLRPW
jgi:hypothetical protein